MVPNEFRVVQKKTYNIQYTHIDVIIGDKINGFLPNVTMVCFEV